MCTCYDITSWSEFSDSFSLIFSKSFEHASTRSSGIEETEGTETERGEEISGKTVYEQEEEEEWATEGNNKNLVHKNLVFLGHLNVDHIAVSLGNYLQPYYFRQVENSTRLAFSHSMRSSHAHFGTNQLREVLWEKDQRVAMQETLFYEN